MHCVLRGNIPHGMQCTYMKCTHEHALCERVVMHLHEMHCVCVARESQRKQNRVFKEVKNVYGPHISKKIFVSDPTYGLMMDYMSAM